METLEELNEVLADLNNSIKKADKFGFKNLAQDFRRSRKRLLAKIEKMEASKYSVRVVASNETDSLHNILIQDDYGRDSWSKDEAELIRVRKQAEFGGYFYNFVVEEAK